MYLPEAFEQKMKNMLGEDYDAYVSSFTHPYYHGLRVNTTKISVEDFLKISPFQLTPVPWTNNGFYYSENEQPAKHPYYYAGLYYIQEPSAMTPASLLPIQEGDRVLDTCAAPGGKSTELAAKLNGSGLLVSNDISNSCAKALLKNLELFGISNMIVSSEPLNTLSEHYTSYFDKILVDAPCSGEGMFRKANSMVHAWETNGVALFVNLQRSILTEVVKMLRPGGMLVYSTCTFSPEEDEQAIEYLLSLDDSLELVELPLYEGFDTGHPEWGITNNAALNKTRRIWPHRVQGEGHYVAMLRKHDFLYNDTVPAYNANKCKLEQETLEFLKLIHWNWDMSRMELHKERLYYLPEKMPEVKGLRLLRQGLFLGEQKKNRFEPSQSLAMAIKKEQFDNKVLLSCSDKRVIRYLKGETIEVESDNGLALVCVDGYPLGWGKIQNGTMKNKYLAGWRWL